MGAELSRPTGSDITNLKDDAAAHPRRVGSSSTLEARHVHPFNAFSTSSSTTSLSSMTTKTNANLSNSRSSSANAKSKLLESGLFSSMRRSRNNSKNHTPPSSSLGDQAVESLDLPMVEWEGYVTKRGHLVRNWKMRFFTLEGNLVSYYENKVDARNRNHLKGRVNVASVKMDKVAKNGHGFDFSFETTEGKVFHCSVPTHFDQLAWVYFLEAGVDTVSMRQNNKPVYNTYRHGALPDMRTDKGYETYRRMLGGEAAMVTELLSYFNKDLVFSSSYPKSTPFSGDYFGREGLLHFFGAFQSNVDLVEIAVKECELNANGKSLTVKGTETLKSKHSGASITQSWSHRVRFGPNGRILRFRVDVDLKGATGTWKSFGVKNPYSEISDASIRSNRSLNLDVHNEVHSPTDKTTAKAKGFLSLVSSRGNREKAAPPVQDPTFKDFTYFCEDPDALVEVTNLVSELRPPPPPPCPHPNEEDSDESDRSADHDQSIISECGGTPLSSFVENGHLNPLPMSPNQFHEGLKKLESSMSEQFERVEVTISRGRPPVKRSSGSSTSSREELEHDRIHVEKLVISHGPSTSTDTAGIVPAYSTQSSQYAYNPSSQIPNTNFRDFSGESDVASHDANVQANLASRGQLAANSTTADTGLIVEAEF
ncbi:unnamed protein product [Peronospora belbahrii]|uniref:PH domain-containing protein n=1 Tax=Peronospora belbahrii TaxID=622444 RepID=A0AAU9LKD5_9STRA|nr:unnamed protein product [Peronospora belbahrii]